MQTNTGQKRFPLVLLGIHTGFIQDLWAPRAELMYGESLKILGELLTPTTDPVDPGHLITELQHHMAHLRPIPATFHAYMATVVHSDLQKCTNIFLRQDTTNRHWSPPTAAPIKSFHGEKTMQLFMRDRPVTMSTNRVKPSYMLNETGRGTTTTAFNPTA
jgi:hypothetical protein